MTLDLTGLESLRDKKPAKKKSEWQPLSLDSLTPGTYLAGDPSITAFGLVLFEVSPERECSVHLAQKHGVGETEYGGWEDLLQRAKSMEEWLHAYVAHWILGTDWGIIRAVHEAAPIGGLRHSKFEVSLLCGYAWRNATWGMLRLPMVRRQDHANLLCGKGSVKKKSEYHEPLKALFPEIRGSELITNEATRDALSIALYAAHRGY